MIFFHRLTWILFRLSGSIIAFSSCSCLLGTFKTGLHIARRTCRRCPPHRKTREIHRIVMKSNFFDKYPQKRNRQFSGIERGESGRSNHAFERNSRQQAEFPPQSRKPPTESFATHWSCQYRSPTSIGIVDAPTNQRSLIWW